MSLSVENTQGQMHRIALLTLDFPPSIGGVQQYLFELSRRIGARCDLTVVHPRADSSPFQKEPFHVLSVPSATPWHFARALATLRPHLTIVGHAHPRLLLPSALLWRGRFIALRLDAAVVSPGRRPSTPAPRPRARRCARPRCRSHRAAPS